VVCLVAAAIQRSTITSARAASICVQVIARAFPLSLLRADHSRAIGSTPVGAPHHTLRHTFNYHPYHVHPATTAACTLFADYRNHNDIHGGRTLTSALENTVVAGSSEPERYK
jgi:hypothetical protein